MPIETKIDPFKPQAPRIPGVKAEEVRKKETSPHALSEPGAPIATRPNGAPQNDGRRGRIATIAICLSGCAILAIAIVGWQLHRSPAATPANAAVSTPEAELAEPVDSRSKWPVAPGVVADGGELAKPWASKKFNYHDPILGKEVPAIVVRLPQGGYWGFSLLEPFGNCELEYVTDLGRLQNFYHFRADHPMVGDPCNLAVFDLMQYGGPSGAEVRGLPVQGPGVRPPLAIEIEERGREILATRME
jgi:hypothetical protein